MAQLGQAPRTILTEGRASAERRTDWLQVPLDEVKAIKNTFGVTVNDVVLASVAGALRRYFERHDAVPEPIYAFVPVSLRDGSERGTLGNQIGLTFPRLPVDVAGRGDRLAAVVAVTGREEQLAQATDTARAIAVGGLLPAFASRQTNRFVQLRARLFSTTCTNVPGPPVPVYFCGRRLRQLLGCAPLTAEHAMTIAALSYDGTMFFSVTSDPARLPDGTSLVDDISAELGMLRRETPPADSAA